MTNPCMSYLDVIINIYLLKNQCLKNLDGGWRVSGSQALPQVEFDYYNVKYFFGLWILFSHTKSMEFDCYNVKYFFGLWILFSHTKSRNWFLISFLDNLGCQLYNPIIPYIIYVWTSMPIYANPYSTYETTVSLSWLVGFAVRSTTLGRLSAQAICQGNETLQNQTFY